MKITRKGSGTYLEGHGEVAAGATVDVPAELGRELLRRREDWKDQKEAAPSRSKRGGGD